MTKIDRKAMRLDRRSFLATSAAVGGGLMVGFRLPEAGAVTPMPEVNAWIVIKPDDSVIIRVAHSEMGQGAYTALPMLVAEELGCDWSKVTPEFVPAEENLRRGNVYGSMMTAGDRAVRTSHKYLREAGAGAREMLIDAAAARWKVPASECHAAKSIITHAPSGRTTTFGAVADAAAKLPPPAKVALKDPSTWTIAGLKSEATVTRFDLRDKVMAKPIYAIDTRLPGMVHAAIAHAPTFGGRLKSFNDAPIKDRPGVIRVIGFDDSVAVVGETYWHAAQALRALQITWDDGPNGAVSNEDIRRHLATGLSADDAAMIRTTGDAKGAFGHAAKIIEAEYHVPFLSHAPMETMNCTARVNGDTVEVWAPSQNAAGSLTTAAAAAGVKPEQVVVHTTFSGGGFGRRAGNLGFVAEAVKIAKIVGKPVQLIWSREEDIQHDFYRPVASARFKAGFDANGNPVAWTTRIAAQSILNTTNPEALRKGPDVDAMICFTDNPYDIANLTVDFGMRNTHVPAGYWRSVHHGTNGFFRECFVDEMAKAAGQDPLAFRRKLLAKSPKQLKIMEIAAAHAEWDKPLPAGMFRGLAQVDGSESFLASVVEISMDKTGMPRVHRVVTAINSGVVVNPDGMRAQMEGSVVWALTAALFGEITIKNGHVEQGNFNDYPMLRLRDMPKVEVILAPTGGFWGGAGEPGVSTIAPALANAIHAATGKPVRTLPIVPQAGRSA